MLFSTSRIKVQCITNTRRASGAMVHQLCMYYTRMDVIMHCARRRCGRVGWRYPVTRNSDTAFLNFSEHLNTIGSMNLRLIYHSCLNHVANVYWFNIYNENHPLSRNTGSNSDGSHPLKPAAAQTPTPYVHPSPGAETRDGLPLRQVSVMQETASFLFGMTKASQI